MSLMQQKPPLAASLGALLKREWQHLEDLPVPTILLLMVPSLLIFCYSPLVPPLAYLLQIWAAPSNSWRDRWLSIQIWRKQGTWWLVFLAICVIIGTLIHIWIISDLIARVQTFWAGILPGQLTFSPFEVHAGFLAKTVLLLPAAPWVATYYERVDPRAQRRLTHILTPEDLAPARPAPTPKAMPDTANQTMAAPPESEIPPQPPKPTTRPATKKTPQQKPLHRKQSASPAAQQMTIDSYLTPEPPASPPKTETTPKKMPPAPPKPEWNWDDVRE